MEVESFKNVKANKNRIMFITVYEKPLDYKDNYVARIFYLNKPTEFFIVKNSLEEIRKDIFESFKGYYVKMDRDELDVKSIVEIYMLL